MKGTENLANSGCRSGSGFVGVNPDAMPIAGEGPQAGSKRSGFVSRRRYFLYDA